MFEVLRGIIDDRRAAGEMLAHAQGTLLNQAKLASSLGVSSPAVARYLDLLVDLLLVRRLRPWMGNVGKRLVRTAKVYIRDSGITHALLDIETFQDLLGHPVAGSSWEGFAIENLIAAAADRFGTMVSRYPLEKTPITPPSRRGWKAARRSFETRCRDHTD